MNRYPYGPYDNEQVAEHEWHRLRQQRGDPPGRDTSRSWNTQPAPMTLTLLRVTLSCGHVQTVESPVDRPGQVRCGDCEFPWGRDVVHVGPWRDVTEATEVT